MVFVDLQLTKMDGLQVITKLRKGENVAAQNRNIPIIAMANEVTESLSAEFLAMGVNGFLRKPFRTSELLQTVESNAKKNNPQVKKVKSVKNNKILQPVAVDEAIFKQNRQIFLAEGNEHMQLLLQAVATQDSDQTQLETAWLNAAAKNIGANRVKMGTMRLRGTAEMKKWPESDKLVKELDVEVQKALQALA